MENYFDQLRRQVEQVFATHPDRPNHLEKFPWLIGALGVHLEGTVDNSGSPFWLWQSPPIQSFLTSGFKLTCFASFL